MRIEDLRAKLECCVNNSTQAPEHSYEIMNHAVWLIVDTPPLRQENQLKRLRLYKRNPPFASYAHKIAEHFLGIKHFRAGGIHYWVGREGELTFAKMVFDFTQDILYDRANDRSILMPRWQRVDNGHHNLERHFNDALKRIVSINKDVPEMLSAHQERLKRFRRMVE